MLWNCLKYMVNVLQMQVLWNVDKSNHVLKLLHNQHINFLFSKLRTIACRCYILVSCTSTVPTLGGPIPHGILNCHIFRQESLNRFKFSVYVERYFCFCIVLFVNFYVIRYVDTTAPSCNEHYSPQFTLSATQIQLRQVVMNIIPLDSRQ